ncbi:OmpA family protein [Methyloparacoccus murrellii]
MSKKTLLALSLAGLTGVSVAYADEHNTLDTSVDASAAGTDAAAYSAPVGNGEYTDDRWYAAPFGTFIQPAGARNAQGGWGAGLALGKIINEYFNVEIRGFWQNITNNGVPQLGAAYQRQANNFNTWDHGGTDFTGGTIDLQYYFMRDTFSPYAVFAMGGMNSSWRGSFNDLAAGPGGVNNLTSKQTASFIFEAGAGATYELADNFLLRGDVRYRGDTAASNWPGNTDLFNDLLVNVGFVVPFGDKPGAAAAAPIAADDCATRDTDADGVNDCDDKCPGTASGTKVDDQGCPIVMELKGVNFKYDSAELTPGAMTILDGVVEQLVAFPAKKDIEVAGYASYEGKKGKEQHNLRLSQHRSESVAQYLRSKGVTNNLYAKGYGTEYPIADNGTEEGRIKNRRVELRWMGD